MKKKIKIEERFLFALMINKALEGKEHWTDKERKKIKKLKEDIKNNKVFIEE